ncbi:CHAP domain-containing protein [Solihabitans fulvus]|uniref:CHAP domain-containing protein n=1 Tax=Solihabitans fulvus TaxID=1892852 RepID=A0A5B2X8H3_9PSEU|nr:CHAP domain-containing protein [Solihabitans fulvus]KAA2259421.1 CHAP domain-containing protein [Solihabitans fulvus]
MKLSLHRLGSATAIAAIAAAALLASPLTGNAAPLTDTSAAVVAPHAAGDGTPSGAVQWYQNHLGSTAYQHYCEKAAEVSYGTSGVWASANAHWNGASPKHPGDRNPPAGAFVYWNISAWGHVGISDGNGGFYATSVNGAIGHVTRSQGGYSYFSNYRGWTPPARPRP